MLDKVSEALPAGTYSFEIAGVTLNGNSSGGENAVESLVGSLRLDQNFNPNLYSIDAEGGNIVVRFKDVGDEASILLKNQAGVVVGLSSNRQVGSLSTAELDFAGVTLPRGGFSLNVAGVRVVAQPKFGSAYTLGELVSAFKSDPRYDEALFKISLSDDKLLIEFVGVSAVNGASFEGLPVKFVDLVGVPLGEGPYNLSIGDVVLTAPNVPGLTYTASELISAFQSDPNYQMAGVFIDEINGGISVQFLDGESDLVFFDDSGFSPDAKSFFVRSENILSGGLSVSTHNTAMMAIAQIDRAIKEVSQHRAVAGSILNALDMRMSHLTRSVVNYEASRGQVVDVDVAGNSVALAKSEILLQSSVAMLASAKASKRGVLELLKQFN